MVALASLILAPSAKPFAEIPFDLYDDHIFLKARMRGQTVGVLFDSGAGATLVDAALAKAIGARRDPDIEVEAHGAGSAPLTVQAVSGLALTLPGVPSAQQVDATIPLTDLDRLSGRPIQAILGATFIERYRVEIDYAAKRIRLFDPRSRFGPAGARAFPLTFADGLPIVEGQIMVPGLGARTVSMMLDTGAGSTLDVSNRAVVRLGLGKHYKSTPAVVTGEGAGGETRGKSVRLPWAQVGGVRLTRPTAELTTDIKGVVGARSSYDVLVGGAVLRRFTLTLDYAHRQAFFRPNASLAAVFAGDRTGIGLAPGKDGYEVRRLVPGSPAAKVGIAMGDTVVSIDGEAPGSVETVRLRLRTATGTLRLTVRHEGQEREVPIETRELLP